jgi:hypothetical protein
MGAAFERSQVGWATCDHGLGKPFLGAAKRPNEKSRTNVWGKKVRVGHVAFRGGRPVREPALHSGCRSGCQCSAVRWNALARKLEEGRSPTKFGGYHEMPEFEDKK